MSDPGMTYQDAVALLVSPAWKRLEALSVRLNAAAAAPLGMNEHPCNSCGSVEDEIVTDSGYCQRCADGPSDCTPDPAYEGPAFDRSFGEIPQ